MADETWSVQVGKVDEAGDAGVPPKPSTVFDGDEAGAREAYVRWSAEAEANSETFRYVMLRRTGEVIELWGVPPASG